LQLFFVKNFNYFAINIPAIIPANIPKGRDIANPILAPLAIFELSFCFSNS
jgi:hypothetical protein